MRLTSDFWVSQLVRRVFNHGGFAAIARKGATEAGSIFVKLRRRDGTCDLFGPAPQSEYDTERPEGRIFAALLEAVTDTEADDKLARELRFDSDLWIVELEPDSLEAGDLFEVRTP